MMSVWFSRFEIIGKLFLSASTGFIPMFAKTSQVLKAFFALLTWWPISVIPSMLAYDHQKMKNNTKFHHFTVSCHGNSWLNIPETLELLWLEIGFFYSSKLLCHMLIYLFSGAGVGHFVFGTFKMSIQLKYPTAAPVIPSNSNSTVQINTITENPEPDFSGMWLGKYVLLYLINIPYHKKGSGTFILSRWCCAGT